MQKPDTLSSQDFLQHFNTAYKARLQDLIILQEVGSTNDYLLGIGAPVSSCAIVCMAEQQHAGKGTKGRVWQSELGASFIYSISYIFNTDTKDLSALSLAIGVIVQKTLDDCGYAGVQLKWPNDLQYHGKKLGGVLVEVKRSGADFHLVCGIGLNIKSSLDAEKIDQPFTALDQINSLNMSRNQIAAKLSEGLLNLFSLYPQHGFKHWQQEWQSLHAYQNKQVKVKQNTDEYSGVARGVDENGVLLVETESGLQKIISADVYSI